MRRVSVEVTTLDCGLQHSRNGCANATQGAARSPFGFNPSDVCATAALRSLRALKPCRTE
jgi:hypothetical protein